MLRYIWIPYTLQQYTVYLFVLLPLGSCAFTEGGHHPGVAVIHFSRWLCRSVILVSLKMTFPFMSGSVSLENAHTCRRREKGARLEVGYYCNNGTSLQQTPMEHDQVPILTTLVSSLYVLYMDWAKSICIKPCPKLLLCLYNLWFGREKKDRSLIEINNNPLALCKEDLSQTHV